MGTAGAGDLQIPGAGLLMLMFLRDASWALHPPPVALESAP